MAKTMQQAAQLAIDVQDACNLSGVLRSLADIVSNTIWPEAHRLGLGTDFVNTHPIVTLFLSKLDSLNKGSFPEAWEKCEKLSRGELVSQ